MLKRKYQYAVLALCVFAGTLIFSGEAFAFEDFSSHKSQALKCQSSCHQPDNILKAKKDKTENSACKSCHTGTPPVISPFNKIKTPPPTRNNIILAAAKAKISSPSKRNNPKKIDGMAFVPAGEFIMGSNERWDDEAPEYIEKTGAFYIDIYEITNEDYRKFIEAAKRPPPHHWMEGKIAKGKEKHPVIYVSWQDADTYCKWAGKRLPNEQEWEKAARGEDGNIYPWGNIWSLDKSNNPYKYSTGTEPVGSYPKGKSPYGLHDMSGNVWEWVDSYYLPHPGNTIPRAEYGRDKRVLKGGSWFDCLSYGCGLSAPTFNRSFFNPEVRNNSFGFRCAKTP